MQGIVWTVLILVVLYGAVCSAMFLMQRRFQYFPEKGPIAPAAFGLEEFRTVVVTTADGLLLDGWYAPARHVGKPTVVIFHGNAGHPGYRADKADALSKAGYGVFLAGYRGYGPNPGEPTEKGLYADGRAALDWLVGEGISGRQIVLYGESLGTGVAVALAVERRVGAVVLEAPFTSMPDVAARHYPWLPVRFLMRDRFDTLARIGQIQAPLLIVHGQRDAVVPVDHGRTLFEAAAEPKRAAWPAAAGHNDLMAHGAMEEILGFLAGLGRTGPAPPTIDQPGRKGTALVPR